LKYYLILIFSFSFAPDSPALPEPSGGAEGGCLAFPWPFFGGILVETSRMTGEEGCAAEQIAGQKEEGHAETSFLSDSRPFHT
jgi:hypothetical protein